MRIPPTTKVTGILRTSDEYRRGIPYQAGFCFRYTNSEDSWGVWRWESSKGKKSFRSIDLTGFLDSMIQTFGEYTWVYWGGTEPRITCRWSSLEVSGISFVDLSQVWHRLFMSISLFEIVCKFINPAENTRDFNRGMNPPINISI